MFKIIVTKITNVMQLEDAKELDSEGVPLLVPANFALDEDDIPKLVDEDDVGALLKTHSIQVSQINSQTKVLETGVVFRAEVVWNKHRNPCPDMVDPNDLVFLSIDDGTEDEYEEESDEQESDSDEVDDGGDEAYF